MIDQWRQSCVRRVWTDNLWYNQMIEECTCAAPYVRECMCVRLIGWLISSSLSRLAYARRSTWNADARALCARRLNASYKRNRTLVNGKVRSLPNHTYLDTHTIHVLTYVPTKQYTLTTSLVYKFAVSNTWYQSEKCKRPLHENLQCKAFILFYFFLHSREQTLSNQDTLLLEYLDHVWWTITSRQITSM